MRKVWIRLVGGSKFRFLKASGHFDRLQRFDSQGPCTNRVAGACQKSERSTYGEGFKQGLLTAL